jgi:hypothetical protein
MEISFINQVREVQRSLALLNERASEDQSQFNYQIQQAMWSIDRVAATYDEVLYRDANEDDNYRPPLKEV